MRRALTSLMIVAFAIAALAAAKPKFTATWKAPGAQNIAYVGKKIVGLVVSDDMSLRMSAEQALARALSERGVQGVPAFTLIPREEIHDKDRAKGWFDRAGAAGVVIMRLVDVSKEQTPSVVVWQSGVPYGSLWSYYPYAWGASYDLTPGRTDVTLVVETLVFDVAGDRLLWAGTSETTNPAGAQALVKAIVDAAADEMKKQGLIRKK